MANQTQDNVASKNVVNIVGIVKENKLKVEADKITGSLIIDYGDSPDDQVEVGVYVPIETKGGDRSKRYDTIKDLAETLVTKANATAETPADVVSVFGNAPFSPQLVLDDYVKNGEVKSTPKVKLGFGNIVRSTSKKFQGEAELEIYLTKAPMMKDEVLIVNGVYVTYKGEIKPLEFVVKDSELISGIEDCEKGSTIEVFVDIKIAKVETVKEKVSGFGGKARTDVKTTYTSELVISGGNPIDEDDSRTITTEFVKKAMGERETYLENLKNGEGATSKPRTNGFAGGGSSSTIKEDDLPF